MKKYILLLFAYCTLGFVHSQNDSIITYQCDFEDLAEHEKWEINAGPNGSMCANQWYFGRPGANGGDYGDLYIVIYVRDHDRFVREDDDLYCELNVKFTLAA